jgi:DNA-binding IclR family transcriptional regulator
MPGTHIKVFDKIAHVIELLATSPRGATLKNVQQTLGLNKGTAFRILRTLESHDVAARNQEGAFVLGNRVLWWESCHRQNLDLSKLVRPHMEKLRELTSETVVFSLPVGNRTVVVEQAVSPHATSTRMYLGHSAPLHAGATGRVVLACSSAEKRKQFLTEQRLERYTERTITDKKRLERELNKCLAQGFAVSEGERLVSTSSVAAPVFGARRELLGVLSVSGPSERLTPGKCKAIAPLLLREAGLLSEQVGRPPSAAVGE